jgi:hypothetical protein
VPKTGGNSLQNLLSRFSEDDLVCTNSKHDGVERFEVVNDQYKTQKHSRLWQYKKAIEKDVYEGLFKFTVVRNPWDLMISMYFSPHRDVDHWDRVEFLKLLKRRPVFRDFITETSVMHRACRKAGIPTIAKAGLLANMDFVLKFENLQNDFDLLCDRLNIPKSPLPVRNKSKRSHYSCYYDNDLKDRVYDKFRDEIDYFGYEFEIMNVE